MRADLKALLSVATENSLGQAVGYPLLDWQAPPHPPLQALRGSHCRLEPLEAARHSAPFFTALQGDRQGRNWTYLGYGPFADAAALQQWMAQQQGRADPQFYAILAAEGDAVLGLAAYLRIDAAAGSIEVGHLNFSPRLQQTPAATEAMYLLMRYAFELGYRRYEWKCDAQNGPSMQAALRLGFTFEGLFRQALVYKGRNRDTAWFSIVDGEWPLRRAALEAWLAPANFDAAGRQLHRLAALRTRL